MRYEEFVPGPTASRRAESYWRFAVDDCDREAFDHMIVPDGLVSIVGTTVLGGPVQFQLVGPALQANTVPVVRGQMSWGVRLRPGQVSALLELEPATLVGATRPLPEAVAEIMRAIGAAGSVEAFDRFVEALACAKPDGDVCMGDAARHIIAQSGSVRISAIAASSGLSIRQFHRRFTAAAGIAPKAFARLRRLRRAWIIAVSEAAALTSASHGSGFVDQAHFNRDTRAVFARQPRDVQAYLRSIDHRGLGA